MKRYSIELDEEQLLHIRDCVEFTSRFTSGQISDLPMSIPRPFSQQAVGFFKALRRELFPELQPNEDYGVGSPTGPMREFRQRTYEIYREIYYFFNKGKKQPNVYAYPGLNYSGKSGIIIREIE